MCYLSRIVSELLPAQNVKFIRFKRPKQNLWYFYIMTSANFLCFQHNKLRIITCDRILQHEAAPYNSQLIMNFVLKTDGVRRGIWEWA